MTRRINTVALLSALGVTLMAGLGAAQDFVQSGEATKLPQTEGKAIYNAVCSGCHMPDGVGAVGAGKYPALAGNDFVDSEDAVIAWIINGHKGMPPLGHIMDDAQIAAVVNYVRHELGGNAYEDDTTAEDVSSARDALSD